MYEICTLLSSFGQKMYGQKVLNIGPFRCTTYVEPDQNIFERSLNKFEDVTNSAHGPIICTYYAQDELSRSSLQYVLSCSKHELG